MKANCAVCGKEFEKGWRNSRRKTCDKQCSNKLKRQAQYRYREANSDILNAAAREKRRLRRMTVSAECVVCRKMFEPSNSKQKSCGYECRVELNRQRIRMHRETHREQYRNKRRKWRSANLEKDRKSNRDRMRIYYQTHREKVSEQNRKSRVANYEKVQERHRNYYRANFARIREYNRRRYRFNLAAKRLGLPPVLYAAMKLIDRFHSTPENRNDQDHREAL